MTAANEGNPYYIVSISGIETVSPPSLRAVSNFLVDLARLYHLARVATHPRYANTNFEELYFRYYTNALRSEEGMSVIRLRIESPLDLQAALPVLVPSSIASLVFLLQLYQVVTIHPLNREKARLDIEKARLEVRKLQREEQLALPQTVVVHTGLPPFVEDDAIELGENIDIQERLARRGLTHRFETIAHRLSSSEIRVNEVDVEGIRRLTR